MKIKKAMNVLIEALREDDGYYDGWQESIAAAFVESAKYNAMLNRDVPSVVATIDEVEKWANDAAENFLEELIA